MTTGHERDVETGLDYPRGFGAGCGARFYDSDVARFLSLDPLAAEFPEWSDYNYVLGNPVMLVDPDGMAPEWIDNGDGTYTAEAGDGAETLAKDAYISREKAYEIMKQQGHDVYTDPKDGIIKSAVDPGDVITVPEAKEFITNFIKELEEVNKVLGTLATKRDAYNVQINKLDNQIWEVEISLIEVQDQMDEASAKGRRDGFPGLVLGLQTSKELYKKDKRKLENAKNKAIKNRNIIQKKIDNIKNDL